ncbi:MAG: hypothetical protein ACHREM_30745 [Polyangiales bacterium]
MTDGDDRPVIKTRVAWAGWEEHQYRGHALFGELAGTTSFSGLLAIAVSGRRLSADDERMLDDLAVCMAVAEPRIWPLKIGRVVASYGSAMAGFCAGHSMIDGSVLGAWTPLGASRLIRALSEDVGDRLGDDAHVRAMAEALIGRTPRLVGFGVPFRPHDERVAALAKRIDARGRAQRRHWRLLVALANEARRARSLEVNIGGAAAAVVLDLGFEPHEVAPITMMITSNCFLSNAMEGAEQRAPALRELPTSLVRYVGRSPRAVNRG